MNELKEVKAITDDEGHWYVIPNELLGSFWELLEDFNKEDLFQETFGQYETGGDLNLKQLYANIN